VAASPDALFTYSWKLAHPIETPRGPYEDLSLLQHFAFFYLDPPFKFRFAGTLHSVAASHDKLFISSRNLALPVETQRGLCEDPFLLQHLVFFILTCLPSFVLLELCIQLLHHKMHFHILQEVGSPCRDPKGFI
jgi:hypothetical protein